MGRPQPDPAADTFSPICEPTRSVRCLKQRRCVSRWSSIRRPTGTSSGPRRSASATSSSPIPASTRRPLPPPAAGSPPSGCAARTSSGRSPTSALSTVFPTATSKWRGSRRCWGTWPTIPWRCSVTTGCPTRIGSGQAPWPRPAEARRRPPSGLPTSAILPVRRSPMPMACRRCGLRPTDSGSISTASSTRSYRWRRHAGSVSPSTRTTRRWMSSPASHGSCTPMPPCSARRSSSRPAPMPSATASARSIRQGRT